MIVGLHHVQITIPEGSLAEANIFYTKLLGLAEIPRPSSMGPKKSFWTKLGGLELHISEEPQKSKTKAHIALEVENLNSMALLLKKLGLEMQEAETLPPYYRAHFHDPFGNRIELLSKQKA